MILQKSKHPGLDPYDVHTVNKPIFDYLRGRSTNIALHERFVILVFESFQLNDIIPPSHNIPKDGDITPPKHCIIFAIRWIVGNMHQPIATLFFHGQPSFGIACVIRTFIVALWLSGLIVVATVCPGTEMFVKCIEQLSPNFHAENLVNEPIVYSVGETKNIVHIFDPPSLMVAMRNFFSDHPAEFNRNGLHYIAHWNSICSWAKLYNETKYVNVINFKPDYILNIGLAVRAFSRSVCRGICKAVLDGRLGLLDLGTAEFCLFFNDLFDLFNISDGDKSPKHLRSRFTDTSPHWKFLEEAIFVLNNMKFVPKRLLADTEKRMKNSGKREHKEEDNVKAYNFEGRKNATEDAPLMQDEKKKYGTIAKQKPKDKIKGSSEPHSEMTDSTVKVNCSKDQLKTKKNKNNETLESSIFKARSYYKMCPPWKPKDDHLKTVPDFVKWWLVNCYGVKTLINNLKDLGVTDVCTKYLNVDNIYDVVKSIKHNNGVDCPVVNEDIEYPVLDLEMARCAFRPMVGSIILRIGKTRD